jgi:hypothetical protein
MKTDKFVAPSGSGPETRTIESRLFENQVFAMGETLGWKAPYRNRDLRLDESRGPSGIDQVLAIPNPRTDLREGWILEAKLHDSSARYTPSARSEIEDVREKTRKLRANPHRHDANIKRHIDQIVGAILTHGSTLYEPEKAAAWLGDFPFDRGTEKGNEPMRVLFYGTDLLNSLGEMFSRPELGPPKQFFWPPIGRGDGIWSTACPPDQLSYGLLAYKNQKGEEILWLRGTMEDEDVDALPDLAWHWRSYFKAICFTSLTPKEWRTSLQQAWKSSAKQGSRGARVPDEITPLGLRHNNLMPFERQWPSG